MNLRKLLVVGAAVCAVGVMSSCSLLGSHTPVERDPSGQVTASGNADAFDLHVGDCMISADLQSTFSEVPATPCTDPHDSEVIYIFDMQDGVYDDNAITQAAEDQCKQAMISYVGPNYADVATGELDYTYFTPTQDGWNKQGDREIDCLAYTVSGKNELTSSVKGLGN
jgi:hypothetical protein